MRVRIDYGKSGLEVETPEGIRCTLVKGAGAKPLPQPASAIRDALDHPIGAPPLAEVARGKRNAVVVISDKTRPVPNGILLPPILETLEQSGIPQGAIEILVGTGLHRPNSREELVEMTSESLVGRYRIRNHVARDASQHRYLGRTRRGTGIWLDRGYLEADLKIVTGFIEPHLMAGFSGGRKGVAPGLAGVEMMRSLHGPTMLEDNVGPGILEGNPFHEDLVEIARRAGMDFLVNVSIDRSHRLTGVFAGDLELAHAAGVRAVEREVRIDLSEPADIVVTSAGGYPLDATFYQSVKGLVSALNIVKRGGTIILVAQISEGVGSADFQRLLSELQGNDEFMARIRSPGFFVVDQWMVQHLCQVLRKAEVILVTGGLSAERTLSLHAAPAATVEEALARALERHGPRAHIALVPEGPYVLATLRGRKLSIGRAWMDDAA